MCVQKPQKYLSCPFNVSDLPSFSLIIDEPDQKAQRSGWLSVWGGNDRPIRSVVGSAIIHAGRDALGGFGEHN